MTPAQRENARLRIQLDKLENKIAAVRRGRSQVDADEIERLRTRADSVATMFGSHAPEARLDESPTEYRLRLAKNFQAHSRTFRDLRLDAAEPALLDVAESEIYSSARADAQAGKGMEARLVPVVDQDGAGRKITKFYGDMREWMRPFMQGGQSVRIQRPGFGGE